MATTQTGRYMCYKYCVPIHLVCEHCIKYFNNSELPAGSFCRKSRISTTVATDYSKFTPKMPWYLQIIQSWPHRVEDTSAVNTMYWIIILQCTYETQVTKRCVIYFNSVGILLIIFVWRLVFPCNRKTSISLCIDYYYGSELFCSWDNVRSYNGIHTVCTLFTTAIPKSFRYLWNLFYCLYIIASTEQGSCMCDNK